MIKLEVVSWVVGIILLLIGGVYVALRTSDASKELDDEDEEDIDIINPKDLVGAKYKFRTDNPFEETYKVSIIDAKYSKEGVLYVQYKFRDSLAISSLPYDRFITVYEMI